MKLYPKHSECPYCKTIYRGAELKKIKGKKNAECYHCHKNLLVSRKSIWILAAEIMAIYVLLNVIAIGIVGNVSFLPLFIMNIIPAVAALLLLPHYIELIKADKNTEKSE